MTQAGIKCHCFRQHSTAFLLPPSHSSCMPSGWQDSRGKALTASNTTAFHSGSRSIPRAKKGKITPQTRRTYHWALKLKNQKKKSKLTFHYCSVLGHLNNLPVTQQTLEKWHLANCVVLQCLCHWPTQRHYAQVCKSLLHSSRRNAAIWNLHLFYINRDSWAILIKGFHSNRLMLKASKCSSLPALF